MSPNPGNPGKVTVPARSRAELADEEEFLQRSLEDLDREQAGGDMDIADYDELRAKYAARAAEIAIEVAELQGKTIEPPPAVSHRQHRPVQRKRLVLGAALVCFVAAALVISLALAGVAPFTRPPAPISVADRIQIELAEATALVNNKDLSQAVAVYGDILQLDPRQPEALADGGWLVRTVGLAAANSRLISSADAEIVLAVKVDPSYEVARAYDGVIQYVDFHDAAAAVVQFEALAKLKPPAVIVGLVHATATQAFKKMHLALPAKLSTN